MIITTPVPMPFAKPSSTATASNELNPETSGSNASPSA